MIVFQSMRNMTKQALIFLMSNLNHTHIEYSLQRLSHKLKQQGLYLKQIFVTDKKPTDFIDWIVLSELEASKENQDT